MKDRFCSFSCCWTKALTLQRKYHTRKFLPIMPTVMMVLILYLPCPHIMVKKYQVLQKTKEQVKKTIQQIMVNELLQLICSRKNNSRYLIMMLQLLHTLLPLIPIHSLIVKRKNQMKPMQMVSYVHLGWT